MTPLADLDAHKSLHPEFLQTSPLACPILNYINSVLTGARRNLFGRIERYLHFSFPIVRISDGPLTTVFAQADEEPACAR